jgi:NADPH:quinone reductase-like Zn-dependent oxidoreductase
VRAAGVTELSGEVRSLDLPGPAAPGAGEVLIDVRAAGVALWDELMRVEDWPSGLEVPHALGVEAAGVVSASGTSDFAVGDPVMTFVYPFRGGACWAEQVLAPAEFVASRPSGRDAAPYGAFPVPALTAYQILHDVLRISWGERVFVHGAGGVTGSLIVQVALIAGAEVVATAGPRSITRLATFGPVRLVDRTGDDWQGEVRRALGGGADAAVNAAPEGAGFAISMVKDGGRLGSITDTALTPERGIETAYHVVRPDGAQLTTLGAMELRFPAVRTFSLDEADAALRMASRGAGGDAVVLLP